MTSLEVKTAEWSVSEPAFLLFLFFFSVQEVMWRTLTLHCVCLSEPCGGSVELLLISPLVQEVGQMAQSATTTTQHTH